VLGPRGCAAAVRASSAHALDAGCRRSSRVIRAPAVLGRAAAAGLVRAAAEAALEEEEQEEEEENGRVGADMAEQRGRGRAQEAPPPLSPRWW
jgi:hypothetical protein